jgi:hypothetical protein
MKKIIPFFYSLVIIIETRLNEFQRIARIDFEESTKPFYKVCTIFFEIKSYP